MFCRDHDVNVLAKDSDFCFGDAETKKQENRIKTIEVQKSLADFVPGFLFCALRNFPAQSVTLVTCGRFCQRRDKGISTRSGVRPPADYASGFTLPWRNLTMQQSSVILDLCWSGKSHEHRDVIVFKTLFSKMFSVHANMQDRF